METLTMEQITDVVTQAIAAGNAAKQPASDPAPLSHLANRQIDDILASEEGIKALQSLFDAGKLTWPKLAAIKETKEGDSEKTESEMGRRGMNPVADAIQSVDGALGQGIPWGSAIAGGFLGISGAEAVDGVVNTLGLSSNMDIFVRVGAKAGLAWASVQWGDNLVGKTASQFAAAGLIYSAIRNFVAIDTFIDNTINSIIDFVSGLFGRFGGGNRFANSVVYDNYPALNAGGMGQFISGVGEAGSNQLDYVFAR